MKTFADFIKEEKTTYVIHGQAGGKVHTHEIEARSAEHAKTLYKKKMKEAGHKYASASSIRTKAEEEDFKKKSQQFAKEREEKIQKGAAEREQDKDYWASRQKEYDKQSYKGE